MSKIVSLLAIALLVVGCKGMYGDSKSSKGSSYASDSAARSATTHVSNVTRDIAARQATVTQIADKLNPNTP